MRVSVGLVGLILCCTVASVANTQSVEAPLKSKEQIRCELIGDCKPLPATRAWITETGQMERDRQKVAAVQQRNRATRKPAQTARAAPTAAKPAGESMTIKAVASSDLFINFESASWDIDDAAFAQAAELYAALTPAEWATMRFEISGHTDAVGSASANELLSRKRAQAVVDLLLVRGVKRSQLEVKGYGFRRPIEQLDRTDGRNRRVEIRKIG